MNATNPSTLESFHRFVGEQLRSDRAAQMTPEEALALWHERQETVEAICEGLADVEAGRTKSLEEFRSDFETKHGMARE